MLIYRCDACGYEARLPKIVGNEFAATGQGFATLAVPAGGIRDLCARCFDKAQKAYDSEETTYYDRRKQAVAEAFSSSGLRGASQEVARRQWPLRAALREMFRRA